MKRIVICCDGTWNTADQAEGGVPTPTNVVRLYNAVAEVDEKNGNIEQLKYYHPGVGTDPGVLSKLAGGGLGKGLDRNIMSGYRFLADNYEAGDEIYLFGFSRGAYTARSLAGMVGCCGLLDTRKVEVKAEKEAEIWRRIEGIYSEGYRNRKAFEGDKWTFHPPPHSDDPELEGKIPIRFLGVWDTVGALGIPDDLALLNLLDTRHDYTFHDTTLSASILTARHAVAMDERRASFQPTLWTKIKGRDVKQLWFPGVHSDVGGGYVETELSDGALQWMIAEAKGAGSDATNGGDDGPRLAFDEDLVGQIKPCHRGILHDSFNGLFSKLPSMPRSVPCLKGNDAQGLHASAVSRHTKPPITQAPYRPTELLAESGASITRDVFAAEPWNDMKVYLEAGVTYKLDAEGEWVDKRVTCGPDGADDGNFQIGELAHLVGTGLGKLEDLFKKATGNEEANFAMTRRHERFPWFCLVGAIANGIGVDRNLKTMQHETRKIGTHCTWTPDKSGYFYAYANDAWGFYDNNKGRVRLTVTRE